MVENIKIKPPAINSSLKIPEKYLTVDEIAIGSNPKILFPKIYCTIISKLTNEVIKKQLKKNEYWNKSYQ